MQIVWIREQMELYYSTDISTGHITLGEEESRHLVQVLRHREGDVVQVTDGRGNLYRCLIDEPRSKGCILRIEEKQEDYGRKNYRLHIGIAPTKNIDRIEWFLEKATEIGIDEITPLICRHSERREVKPERLHKILVSAMKQSMKAYLPKLNEAIPFTKFMTSAGSELRYLCTMDGDTLLKAEYPAGRDVIILIGPEGDFHNEEIQLAIENGFRPVSLGESRLRTETAALFACSAIALLNQ